MQPIPIFHATVSADGTQLQLEPTERALRRGYLKRLAGLRVDLIVRPHRRRRSDQQNRWWFGICVPLVAHELGYDRHEHDEVHYALVSKCFGTHRNERLNQEIPNVRSSRLTTAQFSELMEWAVRYAATELGIVVPLPGESEL